MGDSQHLAVAPELFHQASHSFSHCAANAGVDLVKNKCLRRAQLAGGDGNGQRNPRQLAAGGHFAYRAWCAGCMTGDQKLYVFQSVAGGFGQVFQQDLKTPALHAQVLHAGCDAGGQFGRGRSPGFAEQLGLFHEGLGGGLLGFFECCQICCGVQLLQFELPARVQIRQFSRGAFVAARQRDP